MLLVVLQQAGRHLGNVVEECWAALRLACQLEHPEQPADLRLPCTEPPVQGCLLSGELQHLLSIWHAPCLTSQPCKVVKTVHRCPQAPVEQRVQVGAEKEQPWVLDFPLPERPARIQHGKADGFNFGGSIGMVYEVSSIVMVCRMHGQQQLHAAELTAVRSCDLVLSSSFEP